jgi:hypothetical protein
MLYPDLHDDPRLFHQRTAPVIDPEKHPIIAKINVLAARVMVVMGPMLWAALVLLWALAEFSSYCA